MYTVDLNKRILGVNFNGNEAEIWLWAPHATHVEISIEDKLNIPLCEEEQGYWHLKTKMLKRNSRYMFVLNADKKLPDPASLSQPEGIHKPSEAVDLQFEWTDRKWINPPLDTYIFYELHTGTFTAEGTFAAIAQKLEHLKKLGINAIELMPVAQFPGSRNWGYDGVFPFAVQHSYGGAKALQQLINLCHEKEIAVVLDVVYNHLGPEGNYLPEFAPYFTEKYKTPWGSAINFDDAGCDGVRNFFIENALMWFRDFHVDGLRLDAVHAIKDLSAVHILRDIRKYADALSTLTGKEYYLIAECDLNDPKYINSTDKEGYGMNAQWSDEFHHALRVACGQDRTGYYSDFNGLAHLAKAYTDAYVYDGIYSEHRQKTFGLKTENPGEQFVVFSQNHDQVGNRMLGERTGTLHNLEMQKLMAAAVMVSPFLPLLFMGEEWSEPNPFLYFVDHSDPELAEAVRKGRTDEFKSFHNSGEAPNPLSKETYNNSKVQWELLKQEPHATMFRYYRLLIRIRKKHFPLYLFKRNHLETIVDEAAQTLILKRWYGNSENYCFMNFSAQRQIITVPGKEQKWRKLLDSAAKEWNGPQPAAVKISSGEPLLLQPQSILIYTNA